MDDTDAKTYNRGSVEFKKTSKWSKMMKWFCPCLRGKTKAEEFYYSSRNAEMVSSMSKYKNERELEGINKLSITRRSTEYLQNEIGRRSSLLDKRNKYEIKKAVRGTINFDVAYETEFRRKEDVMIKKYAEGYVVYIGVGYRGLLACISKQRLEASSTVLRLEGAFANKQTKSNFSSFNFDRFWNLRYFFFEKFDEGVKIDEASWESLVPEVVSQYVAYKCARARVIVDAYAGVGSTTVCLATAPACKKIIACEFLPKRVEFLYNNVKVYERDNVQIVAKPFYDLDSHYKVNLVFLNPRIAFANTQITNALCMSDFDPPLNKVLEKAIKMSYNIVMLLPPESNMETICSSLNKLSEKEQRLCCSITIYKLVVRGKLSYLLVCIGPLLHNRIGVDKYLGYIYGLMGNEGNKAHVRKLLKHVRYNHSMLFVLNLVQDAKRLSSTKKSSSLGELLILVSEQSLVPEKLIKKCKEMREEDGAKMEEEKVQDIDMGEERTTSSYSYYSTFTRGSQKDTLPMRRDEASKSGVVVARTLNGSKYKKDAFYNAYDPSPQQPLSPDVRRIRRSYYPSNPAPPLTNVLRSFGVNN